MARPISDYLDDEAIERIHVRLIERGWPCQPVAVRNGQGEVKTDALGRYRSNLRLMPEAMPEGLRTLRIRANDDLCVPVVAFEVMAWALKDGGHAPFARLASSAHSSDKNGPPRSKKTALLMENAKVALAKHAPGALRSDPDEYQMPFGVVVATARLAGDGESSTATAAADRIADWCQVAVPWFTANWATIAKSIPTDERC